MSSKDKFNKVKIKEGLKPMPDRKYQNLLSLCRVQSVSYKEHEMQFYVMTQLMSRHGVDAWFDEHGNIYAVKGEAEHYPCVVAHLDTVHDFVDKLVLYSYIKKDQKFLFAKDGNGKATGIGGDDKCGIFAALELLDRKKNIKLAFFVEEEMGCIGSDNADTEFFEDVGYIMQLDRWGNSDVISDYIGSTTSAEFDLKIKPKMLKYGYSTASGLMTDSLTLHSNEIGVSAINISCGYYGHHTSSEEINTAELWNAVMFTSEMIDALGENAYPSLPEKYSSYYGSDARDYSGRYDTYEERKESAVARFLRNQERTDLNAADIYQNVYDRLVDWHKLTYEEQEELRDDWVFLYGYELTDDELNTYTNYLNDGGDDSDDEQDYTDFDSAIDNAEVNGNK